MAVGGELQLILECDDGKFTTTIIRAGAAADALTSKANVTVNAVQNISSKMDSSATSVAGWTIAIGEAGGALNTLNDVFGKWAEKIVEVNSHIEQTTALLAGFSQAADSTQRLAEGMSQVSQIMDMATKTPFSFGALQDTFVKFKTTGIDPLAGGMKHLTDAVAAFGGDDSRLKRAGYAIQEMAGRGVISLQNLRRQLGQDIPGAAQAMAQSMNMTISQLDEAVTKGTLDSSVAIQSMLDEFGRLYGGAGVQRMQTFRGEVAQLETQFQRLALVAGGMQEGGNTSNSFYGSLLAGMTELNQAMSSPEVIAAAARINLSLKDFADSARTLIPLIPTLAGGISHLGDAFMIASAAAVASLILLKGHLITTAVTTMASNIAGLGKAIVALPGFIMELGSGIVAFGQYILALASGIDIATIAATGLAGAAAGLAVTFATIALPVTIIAGIILLLNRTKQVTAATIEYGEALKLLRGGDFTQKNQDAAAKELKHLQAKNELITQQLALLARMKAGDHKVNTGNLQNIEGAMGQPGVNLQSRGLEYSIGAKANSPEAKRLDEAVAALKTLFEHNQAEIQSSMKELKAAPDKLINQEAEQYYTSLQTDLAKKSQILISHYRDTMKQIDQARQDAAQNPNDQQTPRDLNVTHTAASMNLYENAILMAQTAMQSEQSIIDGFIKSGDQKNAAIHKAALAKLKDDLDNYVTQAEQEIARVGDSKVLDNAKTHDTQTKEASTFIENLQTQIASLNGQLDKTGSYQEKVKQMFSELGKFNTLGGILSSTGQKALAAAQQIDTLHAAVKRLSAEDKIDLKINSEFDKAQADLEGYLVKIENPNLPDAQQSFVIFQNQINHALKQMSEISFGNVEEYQKFLDMRSRGAQAIDNMRAATTIKDSMSNNKSAEQDYINSLPAKERAIASHNEKMAKLAQDAANIQSLLNNPGITPEQKNAYNMQLGANSIAQQHENSAESNRIGRANATAARPGQDEITQMAGRIAELQATMAAGDSEFAKWQARISADPKKYGEASAALLEYAKQLDDLNAKKKLFDKADAGQKQITTDIEKYAEERKALDAQLAGRGKLLAVDQEILKIRTDLALQVNQVSKAPNANVKDASGVTPLDTANQNANTALMGGAQNAILKEISAYDTEKQVLIRDAAETTAARRAAENKQLTDLQNSLDAQIQKYFDAGAQRQDLENRVTQYIAAKRDELDRKTQDALAKQAQDWMNIMDNMDGYIAQGMNSIADNLAQQLSTGKAHWTDFANWAIQELVRIQMKTALSPVSNLLSQGMSALPGLIGGLFGASSPTYAGSTATTAPNGAGSAFGLVGHNHGGGIIGSEATFSKVVDLSVFSGAPRFHAGGIAGNEVPTILQAGEGVFTAGQMGAIGNLNHNYTFVEAALQALASAARSITSVPPGNAPASSYGMGNGMSNQGGVGGVGMPVTVNVTNQTQQPISAVSSTPRFDGEAMVLDIVIRNVQSPGPLRDSIKSVR